MPLTRQVKARQKKRQTNRPKAQNDADNAEGEGDSDNAGAEAEGDAEESAAEILLRNEAQGSDAE